jgi:HD-GYP domain-containing protein (c-di-GMP phosphodiesterase class II)
MRRHPTQGAQILSRAPFLVSAVVFAHRHHERWDGEGYPDGLKGIAIPVGGRLMAVADAFDAMTSTRPYRPAMDAEQAARELTRGAGNQFDPEMAHAFLGSLLDGRITVLTTSDASSISSVA